MLGTILLRMFSFYCSSSLGLENIQFKNILDIFQEKKISLYMQKSILMAAYQLI